MDEERSFIRAILTASDDPTPWLVYADWLEERGEPRGEFVRITVALSEAQADSEVRRPLEARIRSLRAEIDPRWLALLDRSIIELCEFRFGFNCPQKWERLRLTENEFVRACDECNKPVYYCRSLKQARGLARAGQCVALDPSLSRRSGDLSGSRPSNTRGHRRMIKLGMGGASSRPLSPPKEEEIAPERNRGKAARVKHRRNEE